MHLRALLAAAATAIAINPANAQETGPVEPPVLPQTPMTEEDVCFETPRDVLTRWADLTGGPAEEVYEAYKQIHEEMGAVGIDDNFGTSNLNTYLAIQRTIPNHNAQNFIGLDPDCLELIIVGNQKFITAAPTLG